VTTAIRVRELTEEERVKLDRLVRAQTAPVRLVQRARIVKAAAEGATVPAVARQAGVSEKMVRQWVRRFDAGGIDALDDARRAGRPPTYSEAERSRVVAKARARPPAPDAGTTPPTCHWTLDRLQTELHKEGLPIKRSQIRRILQAEHVKWQKSRTWLESDDPDFAEKRGPSSGSTPPRHPTAPSSASTNSARWRRGRIPVPPGGTLPTARTSRRITAATATCGRTARWPTAPDRRS